MSSSTANFTSIPHLHAIARREDLIAEADHERVIAAMRGRTPSGVRRQIGTVLIRAGELVRGPRRPIELVEPLCQAA